MAVESPAGWERFNRYVPEPATVEREADWVDIPAAAIPGIRYLVQPEPTSYSAGLFRRRLGAIARSVMAEGLGIPSSEPEPQFREASHAASRSGRTLTYQQQLDGHDVVGATAKVHFGRSGDFVVTGRARTRLRLRKPRSSIGRTPGEAAAAAAHALDLPVENALEPKLQVLPSPDDEARWVWRVAVLSDDPVADVRAYVDADSLELVLSYNIASALRGKATIYPRNPVATPAIEVSLSDLGPAPPNRLSGARLVVTPNNVAPLERPDRDFRVGAADLAFDEPNAYYHLRRALRYFTTLKGRHRRFDKPPFRPIDAIVRFRPAMQNSFYIPDKARIVFGPFQVGSGALAADILYHELGHAVSDNASRLSRGLAGSQSRGLSEGYSDYFAESALDDPHMLEWAFPAQARNAADPALRFAPGFVGKEHDVGGVWAAVLWGMRTQVGQADADRIAFDSLYLVGPDSTFADGRRSLLTVNGELFAAGKIGQDCAAVINAEWAKRT
jgi:hypothetical protein